MLQDINDNPKNIQNYKDDFLLKVICAHAFLPDYKMLLPEGAPPFKPTAEPMGMTPTNLFSEAKRLYVFCRKDLTALKRESLFIGLLESIHPEEAKVVIAVKDQKLHKMFPKITHKLVSDAGILPPLEKKANESVTS